MIGISSPSDQKVKTPFSREFQFMTFKNLKRKNNYEYIYSFSTFFWFLKTQVPSTSHSDSPLIECCGMFPTFFFFFLKKNTNKQTKVARGKEIIAGIFFWLFS